MTGYSHPDSLIETQWLTEHLNDGLAGASTQKPTVMN